MKSSIDWLELTNNSANPTDVDTTRGGIAIVNDTLMKYVSSAWAEVEAGTGSSTFVGLTDTPANYTSAANKILKVNTGGTAVEFVTLSGDVTIGATGIAAIASGVIINGDVKSNAAIAYSKLNLTGAIVSNDLAGSVAVGKLSLATGSVIIGAANVGSALDISGDGEIIVGNGSTATAVAVSGDVSLANDGSTEVSDLTITSEAEGDILYFDSSNWVRLAAGTSGKFLKTQGAGSAPMWDSPTVGYADALKSPFTIEGGTYDPSTTVTAQTSSAAALTIPDLAGTAQEWVFSKKAQTLENKTLTEPIIVTTGFIADAGGDAYLTFVENGTPTDSIQITQGASGGGATIEAITSETNANLNLAAAGTGDVVIKNGTELTFERATKDALIVVADQTGEDHTFNIPDIATGASDTFVFLAEAQTLTNKTLTSPILTTPQIVTTGSINDANGDEYLKFVADATPVTYIQITSGDTGIAPMVEGAGEDNTNLMLKGSGTGNVVMTDGGDITAQLIFELDGMTTSTATTFTVSQTGNVAITLPDATCTLIGEDTVNILTHKTIDADGTGNVLSNINATELDPIGDAAFGIPFVIQKSVAALAAAGTNIITTHPKMRVLDVWFVHTTADAGDLSVNLGQVGAVGDAITDTITIAAGDKDITRAGEIDDGKWDVAANAGLVAVGDVGASIDGVVFVLCMRID